MQASIRIIIYVKSNPGYIEPYEGFECTIAQMEQELLATQKADI